MISYLQPDTLGLNPILEYLNTLDINDNQQVYEIGVKIGDILLDKYHKKGQSIKSVDQLLNHILELCNHIHKYAPHFYQCVQKCPQKTILSIQTDKKKSPPDSESDELNTKEKLRWFALCNLLKKSKKHH